MAKKPWTAERLDEELKKMIKRNREELEDLREMNPPEGSDLFELWLLLERDVAFHDKCEAAERRAAEVQRAMELENDRS